MDLSSLVAEMGAMDDLTRPSVVPQSSTQQRPPFLTGPAAKIGEAPSSRRTAAPPKPAGRKKKETKHATHGAAPVELMTQFLVLVSTGKMREALDVGQQILVFEPDNPLIKMYHEAMTEYLARGIVDEEEEDEDESSDDEGGEEEGEGKEGEEEKDSDDDDDAEEDEEKDSDEEGEEKEKEDEGAKAPSSERKESAESRK